MFRPLGVSDKNGRVRQKRKHQHGSYQGVEHRSDVTSVHIGALLVPLPDDVVDEPAVDG